MGQNFLTFIPPALAISSECLVDILAYSAGDNSFLANGIANLGIFKAFAKKVIPFAAPKPLITIGAIWPVKYSTVPPIPSPW